MKRILFCLSIIVFSTPTLRAADFCTDQMLCDGSEQVVAYGMDTTKNWWAITSPYDSSYRLWINGKKSNPYQNIKGLQFAPDGEHWSAWVELNNFWTVLTEQGTKPLMCQSPGELHYAPSSSTLWWTYFDGNQEFVQSATRKYNVIGRVGSLYCAPSGEALAFVFGQAGMKFLVVNGKQGPQYDDIRPIGFWTDGQFVFAALAGSQWRIYRGEEELAGPYADIIESKINSDGTVAAAIVSTGSARQVILFSDEYTRPVFSRQYPNLDALILHPHLAMWAARSEQSGGQSLVIMTGTEYSAGTQGTGHPQFTADGKELVYSGCDTDCFLSINGKKVSLNQTMNSDLSLAHKSGSSTFAYVTNSSLVIREIERADLWLSKMCDETSLPRYNWRTDRYECLGRINQRLYLLSCMKK